MMLVRVDSAGTVASGLFMRRGVKWGLYLLLDPILAAYVPSIVHLVVAPCVHGGGHRAFGRSRTVHTVPAGANADEMGARDRDGLDGDRSGGDAAVPENGQACGLGDIHPAAGVHAVACGGCAAGCAGDRAEMGGDRAAAGTARLHRDGVGGDQGKSRRQALPKQIDTPLRPR